MECINCTGIKLKRTDTGNFIAMCRLYFLICEILLLLVFRSFIFLGIVSYQIISCFKAGNVIKVMGL